MENAIRDWRGRPYRPGPVPADRTRMFRLALAAMAAISPLQYGFAALLTGQDGGLTLLTVWIACQAAGALPALHLVRRRRLGVRACLAAGAALSGLGLATAALAVPAVAPVAGAAVAGVSPPAGGDPAALLSAGGLLALIGYAVLGGLGAGLVYGVCGEVVSSWYPERPAARVGLITGAFGYGAVPLLLWAGIAPGTTPVAFLACAALATAVIATAARRLRLPPPLWWPGDVDPRTHALDAARLRTSPEAVKQFGLAQALRTRTLPALALMLVCAGAVSVFDVIVVAGTGAWGAVALLVALNGAGRSAAMRAAEQFGRRRVLAAVFGSLALGQILLAVAVQNAHEGAGAGPLLWLGALAAGLGGGAFYPLLASLVRELFGTERATEIHAVVYSAKALAGVLAAGLALTALTAPGGALLAAAALAALPALATPRLRIPGLPATIPL
ncbi:OFA family MFS transporter [Nonomuraea sp. MG754425]|uniref:MFS transporter n=1 Tax=Nonomuraea sp. MG754425 TaxID=2570319 RepID=UPI001F02F97D|nr:MFS transporter [Nonomuraea sp. MG754425]MCF6468960.1 OFA family MFS transporter [Nonomuraea sp. MG754425]